ncbi:hypothetical protein HaLaN_31699, partial [Haematococcus lacustris]
MAMSAAGIGVTPWSSTSWRFTAAHAVPGCVVVARGARPGRVDQEVLSGMGTKMHWERWIGGRRHFRAEQPLLPLDWQLANASKASTGRCVLMRSTPNPHQPKGLPSSSAPRQLTLEDSEQEDAIQKIPPLWEQSSSKE